MNFKVLFGFLAAVVVIIGTIPYIHDIFRGETKPSRATWILLTVLLLLSTFVQGQLGVGWGILLVVGDLLATGSIAIISLKYGHGGLELTDKICYVLWGITVIVWLGLKQPLLALQLGIFADFIAMIPTFIKTYDNPNEESKNVFIGGAVAGVLSIFAANNFSYQNTVFPSYILLINLAEVFLIIYAGHHKSRDKDN